MRSFWSRPGPRCKEPQDTLTPQRLADLLRTIDRPRALAMAAAAYALGKRDAAARVADVCLAFGTRA